MQLGLPVSLPDFVDHGQSLGEHGEPCLRLPHLPIGLGQLGKITRPPHLRPREAPDATLPLRLTGVLSKKDGEYVCDVAKLESLPKDKDRLAVVSEAQTAQKTAVEIRIAAAPPVAPQRAPSTSTSGTKTAISTDCATLRRPGRPIETGNDLVHPHISCSAAATSTSRAGFDACTRYACP